MAFDAFLVWLTAHGLPVPEQEYRFFAPRKWRFDYAWPEFMVAVEVEGGAFTKGRHTRGAGYLKDLEKYNAAVVAGWMVLRYPPAQLTSPQTLRDLETCLDACEMEQI